MVSSSEEMSFVLIPLMAPGHTIPMVDMAKLFALRRINTTLLLTSQNATRFKPAIDCAVRSGLPIRIRQLRFPAAEAGLPEGCESMDVLPSYSLARNFFAAIALLQEQAEKILGEITPTPNCIISDKHIPWTADIADKLGVPRIVFDGMSCFTQVCFHNLYGLMARQGIPETAPFEIPDMPGKIEVTKSQLPPAFNPTLNALAGSIDHMKDVRELIRVTEAMAHGYIINSFEELEEKYVDQFRRLKGGKVWCLGPLSLCNEDATDMAKRGGDAVAEDGREDGLKWLESWAAKTVVYACLGSLARVTLGQFIELALGLEASNCPFILVVKAGERHAEVEAWISENGYEKRVKERALLIRGWVPQLQILAHPSIGAFLTHCGWNSTLEGIVAGVPMITWPLFAEQFLNEKFVVEVLKTAVSVGAKSGVHLGEEDGSSPEERVSRESVRSAVQRVMMIDQGQNGNAMRDRAMKLKEVAMQAVGVGGSSHLNLSLFIEDITSTMKIC
ncbi:hypothetical protein DM860_010377 [Cuscuta australis]|uniref:Glycosyltransferase n=1 Tax=Cuscuta australis TaxID=267555 RepID=A0A328E4Y9_9ASTE|nr:hypothetical protein DM860_010377 [Cuscuta australis]